MAETDTCATIMIADPVTLPTSATVDQAIDVLLRARFHHLPVVDDSGRFVGLFGVSHVAKLLLPRAVTMEGGLADATFVRETLADMSQRLDAIKGSSVLDLAERNVRTVHPTTPLIRGLQILHKDRTLVPVVTEDGGRLVGVLAFYGLLARLKR
ncbi:MAG: CBS domain-containing protein [Alphaproteobacteria bacterium]